jgi:hypothetical protein
VLRAAKAPPNSLYHAVAFERKSMIDKVRAPGLNSRHVIGIKDNRRRTGGQLRPAG